MDPAIFAGAIIMLVGLLLGFLFAILIAGSRRTDDDDG